MCASALALIEACALSALVKWSSPLNDLAGWSSGGVACITITLLAPYKHNDYCNRDRVRGRRKGDRDGKEKGEREREMQEENKTGWVQYISLTAVIIRQQEEPAGHHSSNFEIVLYIMIRCSGCFRALACLLWT